MKKILGLTLVSVFCSFVFLGEVKAAKNEPPGNRLKPAQVQNEVICTPEKMEQWKAEREKLIENKKNCTDKKQRKVMNREMRQLGKKIKHCGKALGAKKTLESVQKNKNVKK